MFSTAVGSPVTDQPTEAPYDGPVMKTAHQVAAIFGVKTRTVWMWVYRGYITSHAGMYDLREVLDWWENQRNKGMADLRARRALVDRVGHASEAV